MNLKNGDPVIIIDDNGKVRGKGLVVDDSKKTLYGVAHNDGLVLYWLKSWCKKQTDGSLKNKKIELRVTYSRDNNQLEFYINMNELEKMPESFYYLLWLWFYLGRWWDSVIEKAVYSYSKIRLYPYVWQNQGDVMGEWDLGSNAEILAQQIIEKIMEFLTREK